MNFAPVSVCQRVNIVRSIFCHPHVSSLVKPLYTTFNLVRPLTVYIESVNSAHHIGRALPSVHCTRSMHRYFSYQGRENVTSFSLPSLNLMSSPGTRSHLSTLTSKFNLSLSPSYLPGTSFHANFQHVVSIK